MNQKATVIEHFDRFALDGRWSRLYDEIRDPVAAHSFLMRKRRVEELSEPLVGPGSRVLDIGCGTGISAPYYIEKGCEYRGADIAPRMVEQARTNVQSDQVEFSVGDVESGLDFPDGHFDLVIALGLVEYLDKLDAALDEMVRVVRPGGSIVVTVPNRNCVNYVATRCLGPIVSGASRLVRRLLRRPLEPHTVSHRRFRARALEQGFACRGCTKTGQAYYNLEVLFYPLFRAMPGLAYALKRRVERRQGTWMHVLATGYILRCRKAEEAAAGAGKTVGRGQEAGADA